jgi:uncharacterized membrane protein YesL
MAAFRTLWTAVVGLYEDTLVLLAGNLAAVALNLPIALLLRLIALPLVGVEDQSNAIFIILVGALLPFAPTPGNIALAGLSHAAAGPDIPRFTAYRQALRSRWKLALRCSLVSIVVLAALLWNVTFYVNLGPGWPLLVTILWLYAAVFWLALHIYVVPLTVHIAEPRLIDLYRRAAFVSLGHPGYTFVLLGLLLALSIASVIFLPVYVLVGPALISLAQAHALREIRRRHGDLPLETEEEAGQP